MGFIWVRNGSAVGAKRGRRTRKRLLLCKIGMIYTTPHDRTTMKSIKTAKRVSVRLEIGRTDCMHIAGHSVTAATMPAVMITIVPGQVRTVTSFFTP
jgi:hypothetical protein